jgi:energy-coupling factor transporter ATP-binding protein EcfA2
MTIVFKNVSFKYPTSKLVLQGLSFSILQSHYTAIIGGNGGGKTTLGILMNGTLMPSAGNVLVEGLDTQDKVVRPQLKRLVTYIGSDPENQLVTSSVYDEIAFALQASGYSPRQIQDKVKEAIDLFNLGKIANNHPFYLSMGQRFKVLLAAAIARDPQYIILDEVFSMLDSHTREALLQLLIGLIKKKNIGLVMITHRLEDLFSAHRVLVISKGILQFEGDLPTLFSQKDSFEKWEVESPLIFDVLKRLSPEDQIVFSESYHLPKVQP